jgi:hypothetical protein
MSGSVSALSARIGAGVARKAGNIIVSAQIACM